MYVKKDVFQCSALVLHNPLRWLRCLEQRNENQVSSHSVDLVASHEDIQGM